MDFSFFTTDNKSGYKCREQWVKNNLPELYAKIISYTEELVHSMTFKEKIYFYFHNLKERPRCVTCGNEVKFRDRFDKPYGDFCSLTCINNNKEEMVKRQTSTFQKRYGVDFFPNHKSFTKKQKETKLQKYGDENFNNNEKSRKTKMLRYGNPNYNNLEKYKLTCTQKYGTENFFSSKEHKEHSILEYKKKYDRLNILNIFNDSIEILCSKCGKHSKVTKQLVYERYTRNYEVCTTCNPIGIKTQSGYEKEISVFLNELNIPHDKSNRSIIKKELDIYIPQSQLAIEINGLYWHNELFVPKNYHLNKTVECEKKGIQLIHIFEDEWLYKKEIVKSIIKNRLKKTQTTLYARKCVVKNIETQQCRDFLEKNHIQGNVNSKIKLGLFYGNELVSVMTFSKGRIIMGGNTNEWELTRFSNKLNTNVIGSAGKLFTHFLKNYSPNKVISYSDIRLFDGGLYPKLGFIKKTQSPPNYWYIINGLRYYRFNFRKDKLIKEGYDRNKTEKEIMLERKIYRIYDCGNVRWEYYSQKEKLD